MNEGFRAHAMNGMPWWWRLLRILYCRRGCARKTAIPLAIRRILQGARSATRCCPRSFSRLGPKLGRAPMLTNRTARGPKGRRGCWITDTCMQPAMLDMTRRAYALMCLNHGCFYSTSGYWPQQNPSISRCREKGADDLPKWSRRSSCRALSTHGAVTV